MPGRIAGEDARPARRVAPRRDDQGRGVGALLPAQSGALHGRLAQARGRGQVGRSRSGSRRLPRATARLRPGGAPPTASISSRSTIERSHSPSRSEPKPYRDPVLALGNTRRLGQGADLLYLSAAKAGRGNAQPGDQRMIRRIATVGGLTLVSAPYRLHPRRGHGGGARRRPRGRRLLHRLPAAQPFPRHLRRGRLQCGLRAGLCAHARAGGANAAKLFSDRIAAALLAINIVLLALALFFTPWVVGLLAPGLFDDPERYDLAVALTRITFPSLLLVSIRRWSPASSTPMAASPPRPARRSCSISA